MADRLATWWELLRANRGFLAKVFRHDLALLAAGLLYIVAGGSWSRMTVSRGVFAALVLFMLAAMQAEVVRRNAPGLRNVLVLPLRRETLMVIFHLGFALPGALVLALAGALTMLVAVPALDTAAMAARVGHAVLGMLFAKSLVVNVLIARRYHVMLMAGYLVVLTGALLALLILRGFLGGTVVLSNTTIAALFLMASFGCGLAAVRDLDL